VIDLTDSYETMEDRALRARWLRYAAALQVANPAAWAEDALRTHLAPEHVAAQVAEGCTRLLDALATSRPGSEREMLLRDLDGCLARLAILLGD